MFFCLPFWVSAETITATMLKWDSVSLTGDVRYATATYLNSAKSAGQITKDHSAMLTISNLPACTINSITLYVRSNKSAGAAMVMMSLGSRTWLIANGNYNQWPSIGDYSQTDLPLSCLKQPQQIQQATNMSLQIKGQINSVYWTQLVIDYTPAPPVPYTITLRWMSSTGIKTQQLTEAYAGAGIDLPSVPPSDSVLHMTDTTWYWLGWSEQSISKQSESPLCWQTGDWYGPEADCALYALYTNLPEQHLLPDTSYTSGEYAIVRIEEIETWASPLSYALCGSWQSGHIPMRSIPLYPHSSNQWTWTLLTLNDTYRYQLTFLGDSVTIYHPQSTQWIGYATTSGSNTPTAWYYTKAAKGTIVLRGNQPNHSLSIGVDASLQLYAIYANEPIYTDYPNWYLYPTATIPSDANALFTTFAGTTSHAERMMQANLPTKYLCPSGQIIIQNNHIYYNLLGQPL